MKMKDNNNDGHNWDKLQEKLTNAAATLIGSSIN